MKPSYLLTGLVVVMMLLAIPAEAKTYVSSNATVGRQKTVRHTFTVTGDGEQKLKATVSTTAQKSGSRFRVRFYTKSPQGGRRQVNSIRISLSGSHKTTSDSFKLPPGTYECEIYARNMKYSFSVTDDD